MLDFQPFNEFTAMLLAERTESAANQLVRTIGFDAMRQAAERLQAQGLISDDCAAHIVLRLMGDLSIGQEQVQRMQRLGIDVPEELAGPGDGHALQAVLSETRIEINMHPGLATTDTGDGHEYVPSADDEPRPPPDAAEHICPICGEPISRQAIGCRKHWRQVKADQADG